MSAHNYTIVGKDCFASIYTISLIHAGETAKQNAIVPFLSFLLSLIMDAYTYRACVYNTHTPIVTKNKGSWNWSSGCSSYARAKWVLAKKSWLE